jgi:DMSO/TMAO reductase YedYZ molybdopterin-dependent catalytic subunit/thiosulfate reductase cytochrome b subunit
MNATPLGSFGELGFPLWIRLTHWFNVLFLLLLARSGIAILAAHPRLYWNVHCKPGSEWLRFSKKNQNRAGNGLWTSTDEEVAAPSWLALPGGEALGLGRYWHFLVVLLWGICGLIYVSLLFLSPQWRRLIPTSWEIVPDAFRTFLAYLQWEQPEPVPPYTYDTRLPFNALQQLAYFGVIFILTPFQIVTGLVQSPSLIGRFPWLARIFGEGRRQTARSLHFIGLVLFGLFVVIHVAMVVWHGLAAEMDKMILGQTRSTGSWLGLGIGLGVVGGVLLLNAVANWVSEQAPSASQSVLSAIVDPVRQHALHGLVSRQHYDASQISPYFWVNGRPPIAVYPAAQGGDATYERLSESGFATYQLKIDGLVEVPQSLSLDELKALPRQEQTTLHNCIQGWTSIGCWAGVPLAVLLDRCKPGPSARYLVFRSFGKHEKSGKPYYECVSIDLGWHPQSILAYEFNGKPLPLEHGAPLRLRLETKLGFKMVKFVKSIELVDDYRKIGGGKGGIREDEQQFDMGAEI